MIEQPVAPELFGADGFERLAAGEVDLHRNEDYVGSTVLEASFQRFSIFIAAPGEPPAL